MSGTRTVPIAAVTGAGGYVGSVVADGLAAAGFRVRRLVRRPEPGSDDRHYDILGGCEPASLGGVDVLVHCAYDFAPISRTAVWETNVYGTRSLLDRAAEVGVGRTILVSATSAYPGTAQIYGRAKLASESDAFARGMCAIRPGLVYGPGWGGMVGTLRRVTALPVVPLVGSGARQYTVHEDDLRQAVATLATAGTLPSVPVGLANADPVPFAELLRSIARASSDREPGFVPVPWKPLYWTIRALEAAPVHLPVRADSLLGLVRPAPGVPHPEVLEALSIRLRPFDVTPGGDPGSSAAGGVRELRS